ncbi:hypothetical protein [Mycobacterium sp. NPDC050041]|uniref:hypothetical protein n=1 Tax=Mycobacterium sp. NPDC050041 TaxID=3364293 RepID=UPI003C2CF72A
MPVTATDVASYTSDRVTGDAAERLLSASLATARRFCGWHVAPVQSDVVKRDGDGGRLLRLPTLRLVTLTSVIENGVDITADVVESGDAAGCLYKAAGGRWCRGIANITVSFTHGFDDAPDFDAALLSWIDRTSFAAGGGRPNVVGPVQWPVEEMATGSAFSAVERSLLESFRLESPA